MTTSHQPGNHTSHELHTTGADHQFWIHRSSEGQRIQQHVHQKLHRSKSVALIMEKQHGWGLRNSMYMVIILQKLQ